jgi:hypothetical protein
VHHSLSAEVLPADAGARCSGYDRRPEQRHAVSDELLCGTVDCGLETGRAVGAGVVGEVGGDLARGRVPRYQAGAAARAGAAAFQTALDLEGLVEAAGA